MPRRALLWFVLQCTCVRNGAGVVACICYDTNVDVPFALHRRFSSPPSCFVCRHGHCLGSVYDSTVAADAFYRCCGRLPPRSTTGTLSRRHLTIQMRSWRDCRWSPLGENKGGQFRRQPKVAARITRGSLFVHEEGKSEHAHKAGQRQTGADAQLTGIPQRRALTDEPSAISHQLLALSY